MALCKEIFHEKYHLEYYCETCKKIICQKCTATAHSGHTKVSIEHKHVFAQNIIREEKQRIRKVAELYKKELEMSTGNRKRLENEIKEAKLKVQNDFRAKIAILQHKQDTLISELEKTLEKKMKDNDEERNMINNALQQANKLGDQCESMENLHLKHVILEGHEKLVDVCKNTVKEDSILSTRPVQRNANIRYIPNQNATQYLQNLNIGKIAEMVDIKSRIFPVNQVMLAMLVIMVSIVVVLFIKSSTQSSANISKQFKDFHNFAATPVKYFHTTEISAPRALAVNSRGMIAVVNHVYRRKNLDKYNLALYIAYGVCIIKMKNGVKDPNGVAFDDNYQADKSVSYADNVFVIDNDCNGHTCLNQYNAIGCSLPVTLYKKKNMYLNGLITTKHHVLCFAYNIKSGKAMILRFSKNPCYHIEDIILDVSDNVGLPGYLANANNKYFASFRDDHKIFVFGENGKLLYTIGQYGRKNGQFIKPHGLAVFGEDMLLVCDYGKHRVQLFNQNGSFITSFGGLGSSLGQMNSPVDVTVGPDGEVFVLEMGNQRIQIFQIEGKYS